MARSKQIVNVANSGTVAAVVGIVAVVAMALSLILAIVAMVMVALFITAAISTTALITLAAFRFMQYRTEAEAAQFMWQHQMREMAASVGMPDEMRQAYREALQSPPKPAVALAMRRLQRPALPGQTNVIPLASRMRQTFTW